MSMNYSDTEIAEYLQNMEVNVRLLYTKKYVEFKEQCDTLFTYAIEEQSDYLFAQAYYYLMQYYASDNDYVHTISCALEGIKYQNKTQCYELAARSYNVLGIFAEAANDIAKGIEYLLKGIDYCNTYGLAYEHGIIATSLAQMFQRNANYDRALCYYEEAEHFYHVDSSKDTRKIIYNNLVSHYCTKCFCLLSVGMPEELQMNHEKLLGHIKQAEEKGNSIPEFRIYTYYAAYYFAQNEIEKMQHYLMLARKNIDSAPNYFICIEDIKVFIHLHKEQKQFHELVAILDYFIDCCERDNAPFYIKSYFMAERISYAKYVKDMQSYVAYTDRFFELFYAEQTSNSEVSLQAERSYKEYNRMCKEQEEMVLKNEQLFVESRHDTLTALPNRAYFNDTAEILLTKAFKNQIFLGIEILDIDYFKHINDNYGHMTGDKYLSELAQQLQRIADEYKDVFVARYGGDEFVIIYYDKTSREIQYIMEKIKKRVASIKLPAIGKLNVDYLTLSQGCCNTIPDASARLWDYLAAADKMLYSIKEKGRDGFDICKMFS